MGLLIRTLLIWLLVVAVPAQGAAAATMAFCGPNHHGSGAAAQMHVAAPGEHAHHGVDAAADHAHPQVAAQADEDPSASATDHANKQKCSACAACCSVGAILGSVLTVPAPVFSPTVFAAVAPSVDTFAAGGPDRPPRIVLA